MTGIPSFFALVWIAAGQPILSMSPVLNGDGENPILLYEEEDCKDAKKKKEDEDPERTKEFYCIEVFYLTNERRKI